jgi:hypothetical protein
LSTWLQRFLRCISLQGMSNVLGQNTTIQVLAAFSPDGFCYNKISINQIVV